MNQKEAHDLWELQSDAKLLMRECTIATKQLLEDGFDALPESAQFLALDQVRLIGTLQKIAAAYACESNRLRRENNDHVARARGIDVDYDGPMPRRKIPTPAIPGEPLHENP
jgi:hypothetical protein